MASLIDTLIDVLGQEDAEYKKLLELSNNKTKAIVGADIERLQDILVQEQAQIDAINKLEQQRMENVDDICNVLNLRRTDIKLEDILEVLKKQPKEHDALEAVNAQLKQTLNELMKINENNKLPTIFSISSSFRRTFFNPLASLYSSPNLLASIKITLSVLADLSKNNTLTLVPVLANTLLGIETQPYIHRSSTIF